MSDITKLPDKWRGNAGFMPVQGAIYKCADALEAALPKWTKIIDDMSKLPNEFIAYFEDGKVDMYQLKPGHRLDYSLIHAGMTHWRPLCDLDYPPEQKP